MQGHSGPPFSPGMKEVNLQCERGPTCMKGKVTSSKEGKREFGADKTM